MVNAIGLERTRVFISSILHGVSVNRGRDLAGPCEAAAERPTRQPRRDFFRSELQFEPRHIAVFASIPAAERRRLQAGLGGSREDRATISEEKGWLGEA
jgi:hypothetical protein